MYGSRDVTSTTRVMIFKRLRLAVFHRVECGIVEETLLETRVMIFKRLRLAVFHRVECGIVEETLLETRVMILRGPLRVQYFIHA